jgi:phage terminase small subunit
MQDRKLTQKQKIFCEEYIIDWNASRAARAAGYSEKTSKEIGCNLLTKVNIQEYIEEIQKDLQKLAGISRLSVIKDLQKIHNEAEQARDKTKAIEVINKMLGFNAPEQTESKNTHDFKGIDPIKWLDE